MARDIEHIYETFTFLIIYLVIFIIDYFYTENLCDNSVYEIAIPAIPVFSH